MNGKTQVHIIGDCIDYIIFNELCYLEDSIILIEKFLDENKDERWLAGWTSFTVKTPIGREYVYDYISKEKLVVNKKYIDVICDILPDAKRFKIIPTIPAEK